MSCGYLSLVSFLWHIHTVPHRAWSILSLLLSISLPLSLFPSAIISVCLVALPGDGGSKISKDPTVFPMVHDPLKEIEINKKDEAPCPTTSSIFQTPLSPEAST